jgi:hypothetical protein
MGILWQIPFLCDRRQKATEASLNRAKMEGDPAIWRAAQKNPDFGDHILSIPSIISRNRNS